MGLCKGNRRLLETQKKCKILLLVSEANANMIQQASSSAKVSKVTGGN